ncbi:glycosyl transferase [bacterium DOLJORAL78_65_58]|nr:MAG: glycosyl transferase [bacterium DOLZORAL124_64_63]PIE75998.1 MAG: glycosyl transferase [bacterium DOLJORAL78_65_58]
MAPRLSIVIVSWNTRDLLRHCLASLPAACGPLEHQVLVVDNASADGSDAMVEREFPHCRLIRSGGNLGFSRGNNLAFPHCRGEYVLLLNPDTVCPAGSLATLVAFAAARPGLGAVTPRLTTADGRPTITYGYFPRARHHWLGFGDPLRLLPGRFLQERVTHIPADEEPSQPVEYIAGACFLIPRAVLADIGPLDERFFMYFEETDWCWRLKQSGRRVWYCADCEVVHLEGRAAEGVSDFSLRQFQKSYRLFLAKNYGPAVVPWYRLAQFLEYGLKGLLRGLLPVNRRRNGTLGRSYLRRAALQLQNSIKADPPA